MTAIYISDPSCPAIVGEDYLEATISPSTNASDIKGTMMLCSTNTGLNQNCSLSAIWPTIFNVSISENSITGNYRGEYYTYNVTSDGSIVPGTCVLDHYTSSPFALNRVSFPCLQNSLTYQSQNPTPGSGVGKIPLGNSNTATIGNAGCAITASAILLSYISGQPVTNVQLNTWLTDNGGYDLNGQNLPNGTAIRDFVDWSAIAYYSTNVLNTPLYYTGTQSGQNNTAVNSSLSQDQPVILIVPGSSGNHYVVANCSRATFSSFVPEGYSIADPGHRANTEISSYTGYETFSTIKPASYAGFTITGHSPVRFRLTDPSGSVTGFDPATNTTLYQIQDSSYYLNSNDYNGTPPAEPSVPTLEVRLPANGIYKLDVLGTGTGNYTLDISITNKTGSSYTEQFKGAVTPSSVQTFNINYSDSSIAELQIINATSPTQVSSTQVASSSTAGSQSSQTIAGSGGSATATILIITVVVIVIAVVAGLFFLRRKNRN